MSTDGPLVDAALLAERLGDADTARRPTILDVRWDLRHGPRPDQFADAHLPGAAFVDLDAALAAPAGDRRRGRHPLPDPTVFIAAMRSAGVDDARPVVVYDDAGGMVAARAWWLLRHYGHDDVSVLDGGLSAWTAGGRETESGAPTVDPGRPPSPGDFSGAPGHMRTLDAAGAAAFAAADCDGALLDARAAERFRGESEPIDPAAGHIPGARSGPTTDNLDAARRFLDPETLRHAFARLGVTGEEPVGVYCGSGVTAAHGVLALELAGIDAALYPGSWSEWSADPARPVQTGRT